VCVCERERETSPYSVCVVCVCEMSAELLVELGEDPPTAQLGQLKLATIEDQQWPNDESTLSKSGETHLLAMRRSIGLTLSLMG